jgi:hypothetical protein
MGGTWIVYSRTLAKMKGKSLEKFFLGWSARGDLCAGENYKQQSPLTQFVKSLIPFGDWRYMSETSVALLLKSFQGTGLSLCMQLRVCKSA